MDTPSTLKITTPTDRELVMTRVFDAPRAAVFEALIKPDLVRQWLLGPPGWSMPVCEIDPKVGGKFRYVWRNNDNGTEMGMGGIYRQVTPPDRIVHNEIFDQDWTGGETLVTTALTEHAGKTTMTTTILYSSQKARDAARQTGMEHGVAASYDRLAKLLASKSAETKRK